MIADLKNNLQAELGEGGFHYVLVTYPHRKLEGRDLHMFQVVGPASTQPDVLEYCNVLDQLGMSPYNVQTFKAGRGETQLRIIPHFNMWVEIAKKTSENQ